MIGGNRLLEEGSYLHESTIAVHAEILPVNAGVSNLYFQFHTV